MAAYSIGFNAGGRPWQKLGDATIGVDAPGGTLEVQIRIADGAAANFSRADYILALEKLIALMRETQGPHF